MEIVGISKHAKPKVVPFSSQMNHFELKRGRYRLTIFGPFGKKTIEAEVH
jgi:hypothetical protein